MPSPTYYVSPYTVFTPEPDGERVLVAQGLRGVSLRISAALMPIVSEFLTGASMAAVLARHRRLAPALRPALRQLVDREILVRRPIWQRQVEGRAAPRLGPVELAVHRQVNTGGYDPARLDHARTPAARKSSDAGTIIPLRAHDRRPPAMDVLDCLQQRQSVRRYAPRPLPRRKLEMFLQHTARARNLVELPGLGTVSHRSYPSGGARYPLEVYPCLVRVATLAPGIYHYDPFAHQLGLLGQDRGQLDHVRAACRATLALAPDAGEPAAVFVITSVFDRTCWKYRGIPYQLVLQELGALYQTMYLVATALALAPCAMGAFPEAALAAYLGVDGVDEIPVGCFALGVPRRDGVATVTALRLVGPAAWARRRSDRAVELTYADGVRETLELAALRVALRRGRLHVAGLGGRAWARLEPALHARLAPCIHDRAGSRVLRLDGVSIRLEP
ncbi:MAG TPA: SagB family peptide dehydrogenase [Haliangium sp.]|nr:SagB family peptide dehydrogenase [Haliangium sp.]